jgi:hypothetical protein
VTIGQVFFGEIVLIESCFEVITGNYLENGSNWLLVNNTLELQLHFFVVQIIAQPGILKSSHLVQVFFYSSSIKSVFFVILQYQLSAKLPLDEGLHYHRLNLQSRGKEQQKSEDNRNND